jgi:hypothetical protein
MGNPIHKDPPTLTIVMAVYGQPKMLEKWWETLRAYTPDVAGRMRVIVVDDHGTPPVELPDDVPVDVKVYRVTDNIAWNQMGARNLGMQEAEGWCLMVDPDMVLELKQAKIALGLIRKMPRGSLIKLLLRYTDGTLDPTSPNVYLIHKRDFWAVGGYDEDYAGHKGWSDVQLMHTLRGCRIAFQKPQGLWVRYYRTPDIEDATVKTLSRNTKHNRALHIRKMGIAKRNWAAWVKQKGKTIRFRWERVT